MDMEFFDSFDNLLGQLDVPKRVRALSADATSDTLWPELQASGFLDVMVPESHGGAQLGWRQAWAVMFVAARHGLPHPVAQTMYARALLAHHGLSAADSPIAIAHAVRIDAQGGLAVRDIPSVRLASHVLAQAHDTLYLLPVDQARLANNAGFGSFDAGASWDDKAVSAARLSLAANVDLPHALALSLAVMLAGACDRVLEMTLQFARDRSQFGKPIGKFQAVQQQIAEMAELVYSARMASQLGSQSDDWQMALRCAEVAKTQTSLVAGRIAAIAHAVHAAIGVTEEYDLQLYTRRLYEWSRGGAGGNYWAAHIGQAALGHDNLLDFMRTEVF